MGHRVGLVVVEVLEEEVLVDQEEVVEVALVGQVGLEEVEKALAASCVSLITRRFRTSLPISKLSQ